MASPFDFINSLSADQEVRLGTPELPLKDLNRFMLIRGTMVHQELVLVAASANALTRAPDEVVFKYMHALIQPKKKRYGKFPKQHKEANVEEMQDLMELHQIGKEHAKETLELIALLEGK